MTTPDNKSADKLVNLAVELDEQLKNRSSERGVIPQPKLKRDRVEQLTDDEVGELNEASEALAFLEQVRMDLGQLDSVDNARRTTLTEAEDALSTGRGFPASKSLEGSGDNDLANQTFGRFEIVEAIGQGGFARVFRAHDPLLDRDVALKVPKPQVLASEESRRRFEREAKAAAVLSHPAIVPVFESGSVGPISYIASAYCDGETLAGWFATNERRTDFRTAAQIVSQLADAIHYAHQRGIVHRDIKPANILVEAGPTPVADRIRVTDFGLAKQIDSEDSTLTLEGAIVGTPAYMSPEQATCQENVGAATDIYSLGVVLFELMTGTLPFKRNTHLATLRAIENESVPLPGKINKALPKDLEAICLKCLSKAPKDRYESAFQLSEDLNAFLEDRPVKVRPINAFGRLSRWAIRNPALAAAISFAFLSLITGLIFSSVHWNRARGEARRAELHLQNMTSAIDLLLEEIDAKGEPSLVTEPQKRILNEVLALQAGLVGDRDYHKFSGARLNALFRAARIHGVLGQHEKCVEVFNVARQVEPGSRNIASSKKVLDAESASLLLEIYSLGIESMTRSNKGDSAMEFVNEMDGIFDLHKDFFDRSEQLFYQVNIEQLRGQALRNSHQLADALKAHLLAEELGNELMLVGGSRSTGILIAVNLINLASCEKSMNHKERSAQTSQNAINILTGLLADEPDAHKLRRLLAQARRNLGSVFETLDRKPEAETQSRLAIELLEELVNDVPGNPRYLETLARAYLDLSQHIQTSDSSKAEEGLALVAKALRLEASGLNETLVGQTGFVRAWRVKSEFLLSLGRLEDAADAAKSGVEFADEFFADETGLHGQIPRLNAWGQFMNITNLRKGPDLFLEYGPQYRTMLEQQIALKPGPLRLPQLVELKAWTFRREAIYLAMTGEYEKAVASVNSLFEIKWQTGKTAGKTRYLDGARTMSEVLGHWENADQSNLQYEAAHDQALEWLEIVVIEEGFNNLDVFKKEVWNPLRDDERFNAILKVMSDSKD